MGSVYLKRLEIQGFKTFASRTVFEFQPGVSAIVGPNGSGKSNVVDAIRWVLGEQSYSTLRSRKAEDLIFGGGPRRAPSGFAEVSLTIDNSDRTLPIAFDTVTITRRSTRSGDHEYFINRAKVRLRDVQEATATLGGSYTIINQGLVDNVLDLRPEERRRLFEDAADISVHEQRRNEAMRRLRDTDTNVRRTDDVITELEPRLRSLRRQAGAAKQYRDIKHDLDSVQIRLLRLQQQQSEIQLAHAQAEHGQVQQQVQQLQTRRDQMSAQIATAREHIRTLREQISAVYAEGSRLHSRAETLQRAIAVADERAKAVTQRMHEFTQGQQEAEQQLTQLQQQLVELNQTLQQQQHQRDEYQRDLQRIDGGRASYNEQRRALRNAVDQAQRAEASTQAAIRERQRQVERLNELKASLSQHQQNDQLLVQQAEATRAQHHTALNVAQRALDAHQGTLADTQQAVTQARQQIETLRTERATNEEAITTARRELNQLDSRYQALLQIQRSHGGVVQGVKAAMEWASKSGADFALVSTLISAPADLELAIETALGARLQHIVTPTWNEAESAIAALKKSGQGRATFLPLDTLRSGGGGDAKTPTSGDGVIGIASQLVTADAKYAKVVDYLIGRTLVVRDLDVARREIKRIGGGWQIVTVSGEQVSS
ncbi:MAG: chromosome segregation protein SMC, partial [Chloroflexi bacterium]|nr:chromosome segregation protein SMC [Chloroflexota bacterium]